MRVFLALSFLFICISTASALAQNDAVTDDDVMKALHGGGAPVLSKPRESAPPAEESPAPAENDSHAQPVPDGEGKLAAPTPSSDKGSLRDLKSAQDAAENENGAPPLQAIGEGVKASCPSREVAATVKMPDTTKMYAPDGSGKAKADKCEASFGKLADACDEENPCDQCDKAVKAYTDACTYVRQSDPDDVPAAVPPGGVNTEYNEMHPVNKIPYATGGR